MAREPVPVLKEWYQESKEKHPEATHMLIVCDTFDYEQYPVPVRAEDVQHLQKLIHDWNQQSMQRVEGCYALHKPFPEHQLLRDHYCYEFPEKPQEKFYLVYISHGNKYYYKINTTREWTPALEEAALYSIEEAVAERDRLASTPLAAHYTEYRIISEADVKKALQNNEWLGHYAKAVEYKSAHPAKIADVLTHGKVSE